MDEAAAHRLGQLLHSSWLTPKLKGGRSVAANGKGFAAVEVDWAASSAILPPHAQAAFYQAKAPILGLAFVTSSANPRNVTGSASR